MITDSPPRLEARRREYEKSDGLVKMPLPEGAAVQALTRALSEAMTTGDTAPVHRAGEALLAALAAFYKVPVPPLRVLGVRPHKVTAGVCTYQLFGDYTPSTQRIRVWMRTAIREKVSSPKALLNTLLHEFCHHLDCTRLSCRRATTRAGSTRASITSITWRWRRRRRRASRCAGSSAARSGRSTGTACARASTRVCFRPSGSTRESTTLAVAASIGG